MDYKVKIAIATMVGVASLVAAPIVLGILIGGACATYGLYELGKAHNPGANLFRDVSNRVVRNRDDQDFGIMANVLAGIKHLFKKAEKVADSPEVQTAARRVEKSLGQASDAVEEQSNQIRKLGKQFLAGFKSLFSKKPVNSAGASRPSQTLKPKSK